jgi:hypothetical protein
MPAVLVEMGFITNPDQERQLSSEAFQGTVVQALVESVVRFRDQRSGQRTSGAGSPAGRPGGGAPR